ncbi:MAG: hypothetical protein WDZ96_01575 [Acidimicrobiia bacterium]
MTTGIRDRDSLYVRLREVLGDEQAATLMELLPPDPGQLATKADISDIKTELKTDIAGLRTDVSRLNERMDRMESLMVTFDERLWAFHEALRSQTRVYMTATVSSMMGVGGLAFAAAALI